MNEDVFPLENGGFSNVMLVFWGVYIFSHMSWLFLWGVCLPPANFIVKVYPSYLAYPGCQGIMETSVILISSLFQSSLELLPVAPTLVALKSKDVLSRNFFFNIPNWAGRMLYWVPLPNIPWETWTGGGCREVFGSVVWRGDHRHPGNWNRNILGITEPLKNGGWKTSLSPFGARPIFRGEPLNFGGVSPNRWDDSWS